MALETLKAVHDAVKEALGDGFLGSARFVCKAEWDLKLFLRFKDVAALRSRNWQDKTGYTYGLHGTPEPQTIGRAESSGCIRMANWDVLRLARMMKPGFTAIFQA